MEAVITASARAPGELSYWGEFPNTDLRHDYWTKCSSMARLPWAVALSRSAADRRDQRVLAAIRARSERSAGVRGFWNGAVASPGAARIGPVIAPETGLPLENRILAAASGR